MSPAIMECPRVIAAMTITTSKAAIIASKSAVTRTYGDVNPWLAIISAAIYRTAVVAAAAINGAAVICAVAWRAVISARVS